MRKRAGLLTLKQWGAAMAAASALTLVAGCKKEQPAPVEVTVQAEKPEQGAIAEKIVADAVLTPQAQAAIEPKITAPVKKFLVQRGAKVKEGELLAVLENSDLAAAALDNKGAYQAAQAAYATATKAQVPEDVQKAELDYAQAKANLDLNQSIVNSRKQLFAEGAIPGRDLDTAQAALVQAQAAYDTASTHLQSMQKVSRDAELQTAQGQLTSAEGKMKGAQAQVSYSEIRSPINGVVTDRPLFAGETAAAGAPLVTVMDTRVLIAKAHLAQSLAQQMKMGDAAQLQVPGITDPVDAKVSLVSPALDPGSTTVEVWIKADNKKGELKVGTPVKIVITGRSAEKVWKIPQTAVLTAQDGSKLVMVVGDDGAAHKKPVTLGITDGEDVQVLSGIAPNDTVITGGAYGLDDGTKVKVGKADEDEQAKPKSKGGDED
ncbi:efflux RND transporter periplasmic adaptor subunit [Occallatibacter riparius]|uniref:Efflux RND transporter periplasmic adaptor subunit n=1 Tax=Occallatibacter riparius TaxID=1002689 RepID=A0A9J7BPZ2_9BACT|nr:efflux RND transporter periplasmic adaptor subunit [Occallatibacter riparius]UWZ84851.1 efflux RND transporter periplasmic adaptor subunit [Occallatibacter riparius]